MIMKKPTILVTGATGKTGGAVVLQLLDEGLPVRAVVHTRDRRSERLQRLGAEVVVADLFDPEQLLKAMQGTSRAYYCPPWHPYMIQSAVAFAVAARQAKLESVVTLSQWLASSSHPSLATRQNFLVDEIFPMLPGVAHTIISPGFFADNYLRLIDFAAHLGLFPMPMGKSRNAPPSNEDIARVAVAALIDPARHASKSYRPTGPTLLTGGQMAAILGRVVGRKVLHLDMPMWMFLKAMQALGISPFEQSGIRYYIEDHKRGAFEVGAPTDHVYQVTGRQPEDFETIARRYAALPGSRRSIGNTLKTFATFMRIGMTSAFDLRAYERSQNHPQPAVAVLAADSTPWRTTHEL
jgi:uncharacterized protein YbjT (DUF2867 family)